MRGQEFLENLLNSYQEAFDIVRPFEANGHFYDAYAEFNVTSARYVLVKKAELWRTNCFEHVFFFCRQCLQAEELYAFGQEIADYIEPQIVRGGRACTEKDHMYTYITGIFICEKSVPKAVTKEIARFKAFKNYWLGIRGYMEARLLVFDLESRKVLGNRSAREMVRGYRKMLGMQ